MLLLLAVLLAAPDTGVQKVVATIAEAAKENAAKPATERATGDALADLYVRRACGTGQPAKAIVLGIAYALEPSGAVARTPFVGDTFRNAEAAGDRKARLAAMGKPTLRGREDWLKHFVMSAGLALLVGEQATQAVGIQKEVSDAVEKEKGHGTGFSFADLNANFAGIAFAEWLIGEESKDAVDRCGRSFEGHRFLPDSRDLADGMTWTEFEKAWGGVDTPEFRRECQRLRAQAREREGRGAR